MNAKNDKLPDDAGVFAGQAARYLELATEMLASGAPMRSVAVMYEEAGRLFREVARALRRNRRTQ